MTALTLLLSLSLAAPASGAEAKLVHFKTADGWSLCARYQAPRKGRPVAILVHGVAAGKGEWAPLQAELAKRGIGSLAIDLRGHGESLSGPGGKTDFTGFDAAEEWLKAKRDVEAAAAFLLKRGVPAERVGCLGASLGANLATWAQPRPRWLALFSPGIEYRGVRLRRPPDGLPVLVAASAADAYAFRTASALAAERRGTVFLRASQGHGAQMLSDPEFLKKFQDWVEAASR